MAAKFAWDRLAQRRAAQRTLAAQYAPKPNRRRKPKPQQNAAKRHQPRQSTRLRCPLCQGLKVIIVRGGGLGTRYRCDSCDSFVTDPIQVPILVTGKTFVVLT